MMPLEVKICFVAIQVTWPFKFLYTYQGFNFLTMPFIACNDDVKLKHESQDIVKSWGLEHTVSFF